MMDTREVIDAFEDVRRMLAELDGDEIVAAVDRADEVGERANAYLTTYGDFTEMIGNRVPNFSESLVSSQLAQMCQIGLARCIVHENNVRKYELERPQLVVLIRRLAGEGEALKARQATQPPSAGEVMDSVIEFLESFGVKS